MRNMLLGVVVFAITAGAVWICGIYSSLHETKLTAAEFYEWMHPEYGGTYDIFDIYMDETEQTASEFGESFRKSDAPFKRFVRVGNGEIPDAKAPRILKIWGMGSATNGSGCFMGSSLTATHYSAHIRTAPQPGDTTKGSVVVLVERSLFGL